MADTYPSPAAGSPPRSPAVVLIGLFLMLAGSLFTASNLDLLPFQVTLLELTPLLFLIAAVDRFVSGRPAAALFWVGVAAISGFLLFTGFEIRHLFRFWPLILVFVGIGIVLRAIGLRGPKTSCGRQGDLAFFCKLDNQITDPAYTGGSCVALLGGHRLDLRGARLAESGAVLQVFAFWGGIEIIVPENWSVSTQVFATLGGSDDKTRPAHALPAGMPHLVVRGMVIMGGIDLHH